VSAPAYSRPTTTPGALRSAVIYRKLSFGSQSEKGERRIEQMVAHPGVRKTVGWMKSRSNLPEVAARAICASRFK
jgi:hypothetical protein